MRDLSIAGRWLLSAVAGTGLLVALALVVAAQLPGVAAGALLHPARHRAMRPAPDGCDDTMFEGAGVMLKGWRCATSGASRGTVVYLHGVADNRGSAAGAVSRFRAKGFDVVVYDSRAHGASEGEICTYGFFEKEDLRRVLDRVAQEPIVLVGTSLGAAVALQAAADDTRVAGVIAAEVFSDLRTIATERVPVPLPGSILSRAFAVVEERGGFKVDEVSPAKAAERIQVPVLLIHGAQDRETPPDHSRRVFAGLRGQKQLLLVEGAHHNESLAAARVWEAIDNWIDRLLPPGGALNQE